MADTRRQWTHRSLCTHFLCLLIAYNDFSLNSFLLRHLSKMYLNWLGPHLKKETATLFFFLLHYKGQYQRVYVYWGLHVFMYVHTWTAKYPSLWSKNNPLIQLEALKVINVQLTHWSTSHFLIDSRAPQDLQPEVTANKGHCLSAVPQEVVNWSAAPSWTRNPAGAGVGK